MENLVRLLVAAGAATALSACGGGGGGGLPTVQFTSNSEVPQNGVLVANGRAVTASYTVNQSTGEVTLGSVGGPNSATFTSTIRNDLAEDVVITAPGEDIDINLSTAAGQFFGDGFFIVSADGNSVLTLGGGSLEYQLYGTWLTGFGTGSGTAGAGSFGAETQASSIPPGTASYSGAGTGFYRDASGQGFYTDFDVSATTDFASISISSSNTSAQDVLLQSGAFAATDLDFSGSGSVSGNSFSAGIASTDLSGTANGSFYGPSAEEFGGTFSATGLSGEVHIGSFGGQ
ncbi:MAG: transferrin-binding protein-like solute binding protein [Pseudomonadota bacterium]